MWDMEAGPLSAPVFPIFSVLFIYLSGDEIRLSVSDDGRGIAAENTERIFDPGYTGWDVKVGTGLGLPICYQVAREHNGRISVASEPGKGSTFTLSLPARSTRA